MIGDQISSILYWEKEQFAHYMHDQLHNIRKRVIKLI